MVLLKCLSSLILIIYMEMQTCLLCHGVHQLLITHLSYTYPENASKGYSQPKNYVKAKGQRPAPKVKFDLTSSKPKEEK